MGPWSDFRTSVAGAVKWDTIRITQILVSIQVFIITRLPVHNVPCLFGLRHPLLVPSLHRLSHLVYNVYNSENKLHHKYKKMKRYAYVASAGRSHPFCCIPPLPERMRDFRQACRRRKLHERFWRIGFRRLPCNKLVKPRAHFLPYTFLSFQCHLID